MKYIYGKKGSTTIEVLVIIGVVALIASIVIPKFESSYRIRAETLMNNYNSMDTIIK